MYITRKRSLTTLALTAGLALAAGCGGTHRAVAPTSMKTPHSAEGRIASIGLRSDAGLGPILVDSQGRTLYLFLRDTQGRSACTGACAAAWPPLRETAAPLPGAGVQPSLVNLIHRSDGGDQVAYNGHPLYLYRGDTSPGQTSGQAVNAFGGLWYALSGSGTAVTVASPISRGGSGY